MKIKHNNKYNYYKNQGKKLLGEKDFEKYNSYYLINCVRL